jgi:glycine hydroxymethyltransferase
MPVAWRRSSVNDRLAPLRAVDPAIHGLVRREQERQEHGLELIASENFVSLAVLEALGTVLTNKYAEGLPRRRYYGGCEVVDEIEQLTIDRAKALFGADHANVQPHSGAQANMAAYLAVAQPGDALLGLALPHGGHLTHGSPVNFSGRLFRAVAYGVREDTGRLDYDQIRTLARAERPRIVVGGGSAYSRVIDFAALRSIADEVGAVLVVDMAHFAGLVAGGVHPSPVPHAQIVTTTTHKTLRGPRGGLILCHADFVKAIDKQVFPGTQGGPLEHVIAAKAVAFAEAATPEFRRYAAQVVANARALAAALEARGYAIVSGGTDTHLILVDLRAKGLTGKDAEQLLDRAGITVNKNTIPSDPQSPFVTSGIRIGTSAVTTRGFGEPEMTRVAALIDEVLTRRDDATIARVRTAARELADAFPLYARTPERRPAEAVPGRD